MLKSEAAKTLSGLDAADLQGVNSILTCIYALLDMTQANNGCYQL